ncbi:hypothetical protein JB92DRAFT_2886393 [Gautieria morchelliformis]|nr:hypothetical protein JB92DRAFT_2886393 [Gautieria morchelliformis]
MGYYYAERRRERGTPADLLKCALVAVGSCERCDIWGHGGLGIYGLLRFGAWCGVNATFLDGAAWWWGGIELVVFDLGDARGRR